MTFARRGGYRPDIDGLRAMAVLAVVAFHFFPSTLRGGFVGVDIFFVISGFLITGILWDEMQAGRFSFVSFYRRRILRLLPALLITISVTLLFGGGLLLSEDYGRLAHHAFASLLFHANYIFASEAGYFDAVATSKPLLHLWSLAVEEQFYFIWPALLLFTTRWRIAAFIGIVLILISSFAANLWMIHRDIAGTYFLPYSRFWELSSGALLAALERRHRHILGNGESVGTIMASLIGVTGLLVLVTSVCLKYRAGSFPGWGACLPVLGAVLIIHAGANSLPNRVVLSNPLAVWIGLISYPLYLWHWPIYSLLGFVTENITVSLRFAALGVSLLFAAVTYLFVELPLKQLPPKTKNKTVWWLLISAGGVTAVSLLIWQLGGLPQRYPEQEIAYKQFKYQPYSDPACNARYGSKFEFCLISDSHKEPDVVLIGDSHSYSMFAGLAKHFSENGKVLLNLGGSSCLPFLNVTRTNRSSDPCTALIADAYSYAMRTSSVRTVILTSYGIGYLRDLASGEATPMKLTGVDIKNAAQVFEVAFDRSLSVLERSGKEIVVITDTPRFPFNPKNCVQVQPLWAGNKVSGGECMVSAQAQAFDTEIYQEILGRILRRHPNVRFFDPSRFLCDEQGCSPIKEGVSLYTDQHHLSQAGSLYLANKYDF